MKYLIYTSEEEAVARADQEGKRINYSHWTYGIGTRFHTYPEKTSNGSFALDVTDYELSEDEQSLTVNSYTPLPSQGEI